MNIEFKQINRILSLFESQQLSRERTENILAMICEQTNDETRKEKERIFSLNKSEFIQHYSNYLGCIAECCENEECGSCVVNKWCNHNRNKKQREEQEKKAPTFADFFCGAGGLSWGFHRAGFKMSLANDIQLCCIDTISLNHPEVPEKHLIAGDINDVIHKMQEYSRYPNIDVVIGGPPCQGFSMANRQRLIDDPRNHLYKSFVKAIELLKPKFFVMENVRGMLNVKKQIIQNFEEIGFSASAYILNANDYGVPQNRERVIFIGNRIGADNENIFRKVQLIGSQHHRSVLRDVLNLPHLQAKQVPNSTEHEEDRSGYNITKNVQKKFSSYEQLINEGRNIPLLYNHKARYNNERDIEIFSRLNPGDNSADPKIADIMPYKRREKIFKDKYFKLEPDRPCKTITAHMKYDCNMYIHPFEARGLTPREAARIQSFPDDYFFTGAYTKTYMQVGNSVPPLLSEAIAKVIKDALY
jgi:DNA (cytosine-5)-methyltransferase 1